MREKVSNLVLKALGMLLLLAAVLKGYELLTVPVADSDIWSNRYFLIFTVEFELALGIWLLSGLFKRAAWLVALGCFSLFCCVTLYKALAGYGSCGCFGAVHVNPWVTLFAIDVPAVLLLLVFRAKIEAGRVFHLLHWVEPLPRPWVLGAVFVVGFSAVAVSSPMLVLNEPATVTSSYEVLEPEEWIGEEMPIMEHIDIAEQLETGKWAVVLYKHNCPHCIYEIHKFGKLAAKLKANGSATRVALIELPPYASSERDVVPLDTACSLGLLNSSKKWIIQVPCAIIIKDGVVVNLAHGI